MKNLKKVLALVVALTMVLGTVSFAFTDVTVDNDVYGAVTTLSSLGILNGYEDGTFGPEKDITRAEFAAVVCRALGYDSKATAATSFSDVPADHWASGYINYAAGQGIINGMGDGTFAPEEKVTYEQAIKMLVVAIGYEPMAAQKGGWPTGYLVVANSTGMTKDVRSAGDSAPANRGIVAQLTYNALEIPMMEQTGYGTNVEFKVLDDDDNYKSLLTELDVAKLEGVVTATPIIDATSALNVVKYEVKEAGKFVDFNGWHKEIEVAEGVNAADYYGIASVIYAKEYRTNKWEIISIVPGVDSQILTIDRGDIDADAASFTNKEIKYYETATATKTTSIKLAELKDNEDYILNNKATTLAAIKALADDVELTLIENDGDSKYDLIIAKDYTYGVIDTIDAAKSRFTLKPSGKRVTFDFDDDTVSNNLVNKDGEAITLEDIKEGDVVAYITEEGANSGFKWIELICLGENAVKGVVTEKNDISKTIYVDGSELEYTANFSAPNVNDEGTYYLTNTGKVFYSEVDSSVASNYAYILEAGLASSAFNDGWQFKLLTKDGAITIYDVKDNFNVNGVSFAKDAATIDGLEALTSFGIDNIANRMITYKLDANNKIREINVVANYKAVGNASADPVVYEKYNADAFAIGGNAIAEDAVVFNVSGDEADDSFVSSISTLVHENEYAGYLVKNPDSEYDAFFITKGAGAIDFTQDFAVVYSVNKVTVNDEEAWKVRYYVSGEDEIKELTVTDDTKAECAGTNSIGVVMDGNSTVKALKQGDVVMFTADENGVATNFAKIVEANNSTAKTGAAFATNASAVAEINADEDLEVVTGYIVNMNTTSNGINIDYKNGASGAAADGTITVKAAANGYTYYNRSADKVSIVAGDWQGANTIDTAEPVKDTDGNITGYSEGTFFFAILENGVVSDIITYSARKTDL